MLRILSTTLILIMGTTAWPMDFRCEDGYTIYKAYVNESRCICKKAPIRYTGCHNIYGTIDTIMTCDDFGYMSDSYVVVGNVTTIRCCNQKGVRYMERDCIKRLLGPLRDTPNTPYIVTEGKVVVQHQTFDHGKRETTVRKWTFVRESESTVDTNSDINRTSRLETSAPNTSTSKSDLPAFLSELAVPSSSPEGSEIGSDLGHDLDPPSQSTSIGSNINVESLQSRTKQKVDPGNKNKKLPSSKAKTSPDKVHWEDNDEISSSLESQITEVNHDTLDTTFTLSKTSQTGTLSTNGLPVSLTGTLNFTSSVSDKTTTDRSETISATAQETNNKSQTLVSNKSPGKRGLQKVQADSSRYTHSIVTPTKQSISPRKCIQLERRRLEEGKGHPGSNDKKVGVNSTISEMIPGCYGPSVIDSQDSVFSDLKNEIPLPKKSNSNDRIEKVDFGKKTNRSARIHLNAKPDVKRRSLRLLSVNSSGQSDKNECAVKKREQGRRQVKQSEPSQIKTTKSNDTDKQSFPTVKNLNSSSKGDNFRKEKILEHVSLGTSPTNALQGARQESDHENRLEMSSPQSDDEDIDNGMSDAYENVNNQSETSTRIKERNIVNNSPRKSTRKCAMDLSRESKHRKYISTVEVPVNVSHHKIWQNHDNSQKGRNMKQNISIVNPVNVQASLNNETTDTIGEKEDLIEDEHIFSGSQASAIERSREDIFYTSDENFGNIINDQKKRGKESTDFVPSPSKKQKFSGRKVSSVTMETDQLESGQSQNLEGQGQDKVIRRENNEATKISSAVEGNDKSRVIHKMDDVDDLDNDGDNVDGDLESRLSNEAMNHNKEVQVSHDPTSPMRPESILVSSETPFRKVPAKSIKKRVRIFSDENDSVTQDFSDQTITMWRGQDRNRTSRDVIDLDIVLDSVTNIIGQERSSCDNSLGKKALNSMLVYTRKEITDVINRIEDLKVDKKDLSGSKKDVKTLRKRLMDLQQEKKSLIKKIKAIKDEGADKMKDINHWLTNMAQLLKMNKHPRSPKKVEYVTYSDFPDHISL